MARILVIGQGSIGRRHARVAAEMGHEVVKVSRRGGPGVFSTVSEALYGNAYAGAIIATETAQHATDLRALEDTRFTGRILIEKPIFAGAGDAPGIGKLFTDRISVAYNLRFHPLIARAARQVREVRVLNVVAHVGQDLRQWRDRPVEDTYSTSQKAGGGVLRDLSHELDYLLWMLGPWASVCAAGGRVSELPGDADDAWGIVVRFASGAIATVSVDYFCTPPTRQLTINTAQDTIKADLVRGAWSTKGEETTHLYDRDETYRSQLAAWLEGDSALCSFDEGVGVLRLIEAIERAALTGETITA